MISTSNTELAFMNVTLSDTVLNTTGVFSSSKSFRKYTYHIDKNALYLTIYGGLVNKKYPTGDFNIDIRDDLENVNTVYLKNNDELTVIFTR